MINSPHELRRAIRNGCFHGITTGHASGYVQANLAIVPSEAAEEFVAFCEANIRSCPVLAVGRPGEPNLPSLGIDIDVRSDLPAYRLYRDGVHIETQG